MEDIPKEIESGIKPLTAIEAKERARRRKIVFFNVLSSIIVIAALLWTVQVYFHLGKSLYTDDAQVESYINPISTRVPGYIRTIRFSEHQHVRKGDTLVVIDDREFRIAVEMAEASLMDANAGKTVVLSGQEIARNSVGISGANIEEVKAGLVNAEINLKRFQNLVHEDAATAFQLDQQRSQRDALQARYNSLVRQMQTSKLNTKETGQRVTVSEASIKRAGAGLEQARLNLSYTVVLAPYDGVLGRKAIEEGQYITVGQSLVTIVRNDEKWVSANFTESQLLGLKIGDKVKISVDAIPDKDYYGKIIALSGATGSRYSVIPVDNATGNFVKVQQRFPVKIEFGKENSIQDLDLLKAGMNVEVQSVK